MALWGGRFEKGVDQFTQEFGASLEVDKNMAAQDIAGSRAHARMLAEQGIISAEDQAAIDEGLAEIAAQIKAGTFVWDVNDEDVHMAVEGALTRNIGTPGGRLHTGRSRNDQVATDIRLLAKDLCEQLMGGNVALRRVLLDAADKAGAVLRCGAKVMRIDKKDNGFAMVTTDGVYIGENVVFATGSNATSGVDSLALLAPLGHKCTKRLAAISYIPCTSVKGASGVRARAALTLFDGDRKVFCRQGELLFNDKALSGILAFEASSVYSRLMRRGIKCAGAIDFVPDKSAGEVEAFFALSDADCVQALCAYLHKSLAAAVAKRAGTEGKARDNAAILARTLKNYTLGFDGVCDIKNAQVVCGGLELTDFDPRTMESTKVKGLYATGEALDVDGECGGYNLHWAWASAYAAARAIAGEINV